MRRLQSLRSAAARDIVAAMIRIARGVTRYLIELWRRKAKVRASEAHMMDKYKGALRQLQLIMLRMVTGAKGEAVLIWRRYCEAFMKAELEAEKMQKTEQIASLNASLNAELDKDQMFVRVTMNAQLLDYHASKDAVFNELVQGIGISTEQVCIWCLLQCTVAIERDTSHLTSLFCLQIRVVGVTAGSVILVSQVTLSKSAYDSTEASATVCHGSGVC